MKRRLWYVPTSRPCQISTSIVTNFLCVQHESNPHHLTGILTDHDSNSQLLSNQKSNHESNPHLLTGKHTDHDSNPQLLSNQKSHHVSNPHLLTGKLTDHNSNSQLLSNKKSDNKSNPHLQSDKHRKRRIRKWGGKRVQQKRKNKALREAVFTDYDSYGYFFFIFYIGRYTITFSKMKGCCHCPTDRITHPDWLTKPVKPQQTIQPKYWLTNRSINPPIDEPIVQSTNRSIHWSTDHQPTNQPIDRPTVQSTNRLIAQSTDLKPTNQTILWPTDWITTFLQSNQPT